MAFSKKGKFFMAVEVGSFARGYERTQQLTESNKAPGSLPWVDRIKSWIPSVDLAKIFPGVDIEFHIAGTNRALRVDDIRGRLQELHLIRITRAHDEVSNELTDAELEQKRTAERERRKTLSKNKDPFSIYFIRAEVNPII